jgi:hypothetical protein
MNEANESTAGGAIGANEAKVPPIRRGIGANEAMRSPGAGSARTKPPGALLRWDDPRWDGVWLGTNSGSMHAFEDGASPDKKTPGWTIVVLEELIHPALFFQTLAAPRGVVRTGILAA